MAQATCELTTEVYTQIGTGRDSTSYQATAVYKGRTKKTIEFVACKTLDAARSNEVCNYSEIARSLNHPHIVAFKNWYRTSHHFWCIIEYCPGGTLLELLEQDKRLPEPIIRIFGADILSALLYLHKNGVIYRDLQPRNILLDEAGNLKLNDFTHAERLLKPFPLSVPDADMIEFMAPELFSDQGVASFASDHWALGCILYRMASGATPFAGPERDETIAKIHGSECLKVVNYSDDLNDLLHKLLRKDCFERIQWADIIKHPFWRDSLTKRLDKTFVDFSPTMLPDQPRIGSNRHYTQMEKPRSTIALPANGRIDFQQTSVLRGQSIKALIMNSKTLEPPTLVFNGKIEALNIRDFDPADFVETANGIASDDPAIRQRTLMDVLSTFDSDVERKTKISFILFLLSQVNSPTVATVLAKSEFHQKLLILAKKEHEKRVPLASGYVLLHAAIVRNAEDIMPVNLSNQALAPLKELGSVRAEKLARKCIMCIGEIVFYIARSKRRLDFPSFAGQVLLEQLTSRTGVAQHYAIRAISNVLTQKRWEEILNIDDVEEAMIGIDTEMTGDVLESYVTCWIMICLHKDTNYVEKMEQLAGEFLVKESATARTLGIILATTVLALPKFAKELEQIIRYPNDGNSVGELKMKALLAICIVYDANIDGFSKISESFFSVLEKIEKDDRDGTAAVAKWTAAMAGKILKKMTGQDNFDLSSVILQAMRIKPCRKEMWTGPFLESFNTMLSKVNFDLPGSENLFQIIELALDKNLCDVMIVKELVRALDSSAGAKFCSLKLIAGVSQRQLQPQFVKFVIANIIPRAVALLSDESIIADLVLRILSYAANADKSLVSKLVDKEKLRLIFARIVDNASANALTAHIIESNETTIDVLVGAGLIDVIVHAMDGPEGVTMLGLIHVVLFPLAKQCNATTYSSQLSSAIEMIAPFAGLAEKLAKLIPQDQKAAQCLYLLISVFTPSPGTGEVSYTAGLNAFGKILKGSSGSSPSEGVIRVIVVLTWAVGRNTYARDAVINSAELIAGLERVQKERATKEVSDLLKAIH